MKKGEKCVWIFLIIIIIGVIIMAFYEYRYEKNQVIEERIFQVSGINKIEETLDIYTTDGQLFSVEWRHLHLYTDVKAIDEAYIMIPFTDGKLLTDENSIEPRARWIELHIQPDIWNSQSVQAGECLGTLFVTMLVIGGIYLIHNRHHNRNWET